MRFCTGHWQTLRAEIEKRGLSQLVPASGEEAARRVVASAQGSDAARDFDPLMAAHNMIVSNVVDTMRRHGADPLVLFTGDHCPLCVIVESCGCGMGEGCPFHTWPSRAADDVLKIAREKGLVACG